MSRFFDLLQRLNHQTQNSGVHSNGGGAETKKKTARDLDEALSALLPEEIRSPEIDGDASDFRKHRQTLADRTEEPDSDTEFQNIPEEEVQIRPQNRLVLETDPNGPGADRFRLLRMRLQEFSNGKNGKSLKSLLITSPLPEEGKSTVALNLATVLAERGKRRVLLIEADLHRAPLIHQLSVNSGAGLAECLEKGLSPMAAIRRLNPLGWYLLPAGRAHTSPTELLQGEGLSGLMHKVAAHFDWILVDSPPVTPLSDAVSLSRHANASLLIVRAGRTPKEDVERAIALLGQQKIVGVILNGVEGLNGLYSRYSTYYQNGNDRVRTVHGKPVEAGISAFGIDRS